MKLMKRIERSQYEKILSSSRVLARDRNGAKVLLLPDESLIKIFRRKRLMSTALFYPYALRFVRNVRFLIKRNIPTVEIIDTAYCPAAERHLVTYRPLSGKTLRQSLAESVADRPALLAEFACFIATLHQKGVYFRSLHFGNVIVSPDHNGMGLIDVADTSFRAGPLSVRQRVRNFNHFLRYKEDLAELRTSGWKQFVNDYLTAANLPPHDASKFLKVLGAVAERYSVGVYSEHR